MKKIIKKADFLALLNTLQKRRKLQLLALPLLMLLSSASEIFSITSIIPFLSLLQNTSNIENYSFIELIIKITGLSGLTIIVIVFIVATLISSTLRLLLLLVNTNISFSIGSDITREMYKKIILSDYEYHININSSEIINTIIGKTNVLIYNFINPMLNFIASIIILFAIIFTLIYIDPYIAFISLASFSSLYLAVALLNKKRLKINGEKISSYSTASIKHLQESLGGIRDIIIDQTHDTYTEIYNHIDHNLRTAQASNIYIGGAPRYVLECLGMIGIALLAYSISTADGGNFSKTLPMLAVLALGAQRMLPALQQLYNSWTLVASSQSSVNDVLSILNNKNSRKFSPSTTNNLTFNNSIKLKNLSFKYQNSDDFVFQNLNFEIQKGDRIGIMGSTGSGKSTLIDLIMGLLSPSSGTIEIDSTALARDNDSVSAWQKNISHVPQNIYLSDSSILENIAFGIPNNKIDKNKVFNAAFGAQLINTIDSLPNKYETLVGERGVKFSGGQRQRIGIARALYKQSSVIILDEATNALDAETERAVINSINQLSPDVTLIFIAHNESALKCCNIIYQMKSGNIVPIN